MDILHTLINFVMHIDQYLLAFVNQYGAWAYGVLFLIIFCETGLVVTPILPGDSMLFAAGAIAATTQTDRFNVHILFVLLVTASILGNCLNYLIGRFLGPKIFKSETSLFLNKDYLARGHAFYEKFGGKTIIIARFIPIIRTFAPFVAGISGMGYRKFFLFNFVGAVLWIGSLLYAGFLFSNIPWVKENFSMMILLIIAVSLLPAIIEILRHSLCKRRKLAN